MNDMTGPDELRSVLYDLVLSNSARAKVRAAADAWDETEGRLFDSHGMVMDLRKRLEAAEYELATWKKAWADPYGTAKIIRAAFTGEEPNVSV